MRARCISTVRPWQGRREYAPSDTPAAFRSSPSPGHPPLSLRSPLHLDVPPPRPVKDAAAAVFVLSLFFRELFFCRIIKWETWESHKTQYVGMPSVYVHVCECACVCMCVCARICVCVCVFVSYNVIRFLRAKRLRSSEECGSLGESTHDVYTRTNASRRQIKTGHSTFHRRWASLRFSTSIYI